MNPTGPAAADRTRSTRDLGRFLAAGVLALGLVTASARATPPSSAVSASMQASDARIAGRDDTWTTQWLQWDWRDARGGLFARAERRARDSGSGPLATLGGHWIGAHWIVSGQIEAGSGPAFIPRHAAEIHAGYRLDASHVIRAGYRQAAYHGSTLRLWSVSGLLYRGDDEWELGLRQGTLDTARAQRIAYALLRGQWGCGPHLTCGVRASAGRNLFGADEPGLDTGNGWQAGGFFAYHLTKADSLRLDLDAGRASRFRQNTLGLTYRHALDR